jgi:hypothetical protein
MNIRAKLAIAAMLAVFVVPGISFAQSASVASTVSTASLQAEIASLLAEVQQLETQLAAAGGSTVSWCYSFNTNLSIGMSGSAVTALQTALQKDGESVSVNGTFDDQTAAAVTGFQEKYATAILAPNGLTNGTGYAGVSTRAELNSLFGCNGVVPPPIVPPVTVQPSTPVVTPAIPSNSAQSLSFSVAKSFNSGSVGVLTNSTSSLLDAYYITAPAGIAYTLNTVTVNVGSQVTTGGLSIANLRVYVVNPQNPSNYQTMPTQWFGATQTIVNPNAAYTYSGSFSVPAGTTEEIEIFGDTVNAIPGTYISPFSIGVGTTGVTSAGATIVTTGSTPGSNIGVQGPSAISNEVPVVDWFYPTPPIAASGQQIPLSIRVEGAGLASVKMTFTCPSWITQSGASCPAPQSISAVQNSVNTTYPVSFINTTGSTGQVQIALQGLDANGNVLISANTTIDISPGASAAAIQPSFTASQTTVPSGSDVTFSWNFPAPTSNSVTDITVDCAPGLSIYDVTNGQAFGCGDLVHPITTSGSDVLQFTNSGSAPIQANVGIDIGTGQPLTTTVTVNPAVSASSGGSVTNIPTPVLAANFSSSTYSRGTTQAEVSSFVISAPANQAASVISSITMTSGVWAVQNMKVTVNGVQFGNVQPTVTAFTPYTFGLGGSPIQIAAGAYAVVNVYEDIPSSTSVGFYYRPVSLTGFSGSSGFTGNVSGQTVTVVNATTTMPTTIPQNTLSLSTSQIGASSNRLKLTTDQLATLTFTPGNSGSVALNTLNINFSGSALSTSPSNVTAFQQGLSLMLNGTQYTPTGMSCAGGSCTASWNFGSGINGFMVNGPTTFTLVANDYSTTVAAGTNNAVSLSATISTNASVTYTDGTDSNGTTMTNLPLPASIITPVQVFNVQFAQGT